MAGASSPSGDGRRWCVELMIGNCAGRQNCHAMVRDMRLALERRTAPHVCWFGPGPISTYCFPGQSSTDVPAWQAAMNATHESKFFRHDTRPTCGSQSAWTSRVSRIRRTHKSRLPKTTLCKSKHWGQYLHRSDRPQEVLTWRSVSSKPTTSSSISLTRSSTVSIPLHQKSRTQGEAEGEGKIDDNAPDQVPHQPLAVPALVVDPKVHRPDARANNPRPRSVRLRRRLRGPVKGDEERNRSQDSEGVLNWNVHVSG